MPELPEVETIARGLAPGLTGRRITAVSAPWPLIARPSFPVFRERVEGRRVTAVRRRAKLLLLDLDDGTVVAFHLKMSGGFSLGPAGRTPDKHVHLILTLDDGAALFFREIRKFGYAAALLPEELAQWEFWRTLGPEPLEIGPEEFMDRLAGRRGRVKALLLNQTVVVGIGNIYADEALFRAGIRPDTPVEKISRDRLTRLHGAVQEVLREGIAAGGSSIRDYRSATGEIGTFQETFSVYGRAGQPCPSCGRALESSKVAGRTSTFCRKCQR